MKAVFPFSNQCGFSLIEIAIVMVIIGILSGGGVFVLGMLTERKVRNDTIEYLDQAREALLSYAGIQGKLPLASADTDGTVTDGDSQPSGYLPYLDLKLRPTDSYKRVLWYEMNSRLRTHRAMTCDALKAGLSGDPKVVDGDGSSKAFSVAAVLISAGPRDADRDGNVFDGITSDPHQGDNTDGNPNYLRYPPGDRFDDLVAYIGEHELYGVLCEYLTLAVNNNSGSKVYVRNVGQENDLDSLEDGEVGSYEIMSGTRIEIRSENDGGGTVVPSTPPTPIMLAGKGHTIDIP